MNILLKHIKRNMDENIGRTMLIKISLFVVSILVAMISMSVLFVVWIGKISAEMGQFDYVVYSSTEKGISMDTCYELEKDFELVGISQDELGYIVDEKGEYQSVTLNGVKIEQAIRLKTILLGNKDSIELNENEVIVAPNDATKFHLKNGQEFEFYGRNGQKHILKVKHIVKSDFFKGFITNEETFMRIKELDQMEYKALVVNNKNEKELEKEKIDDYEMEYGLHFVGLSEGDDREEINTLIQPAVIVVLLIFVVIFVSLNSIVKIIINERMAIVGTFRSLGASMKQIIGVLTIEMLRYTIVPSLLGAMIGVFILKGAYVSLQHLFSSFFGMSSLPSMKEAFLMISFTTVIATILFQMLLSLPELIKLSKISIKDCIFSKHFSVYKYSKTKVILGLFMLLIGLITIIKHKQLTYWYGIIGLVATFISIAMIVPMLSKHLVRLMGKNQNPIVKMAQNTVKTSSLQINTTIIFIVAISVSLVACSFFSYMIFVNQSKKNMLATDVFVEELISPYDKTDEFYKIENVQNVSALYDISISNNYYDEILLANHKINEVHLIYSNDYESLMRVSNTFNVDANTCSQLGKYEVIISDYYQRMYDLHQGDIIVLSWKREKEAFTISTPINCKIVGFADFSKFHNNAILVSSILGQEMEEYLFNGGYSSIQYFITVNNGETNAKEVRKRIINELGIHSNGSTGNVYTREGYLKHIKNTTGIYLSLVGVATLLITLLALVGIINNQTVSFMERRREFATFYSIAMSRAQLKNMVLIENLIAFITSIIASVLFYLIIVKIVENLLQVLLYSIYLKFTIVGILAILAVVALILLAIQKSMRKHIKNMNVVEEIKYE